MHRSGGQVETCLVPPQHPPASHALLGTPQLFYASPAGLTSPATTHLDQVWWDDNSTPYPRGTYTE